jgi:oligoribonuclease
MKYLSLDIETTGLDWEKCQILQIAGIIEDTDKKLPRSECPQFNLFVKHNVYVGEAYALHLNGWILEKLHTGNFLPGETMLQSEQVATCIYKFCREYGLLDKHDSRIVAAGKNFSGFDKNFIKRLHLSEVLDFHQRVLDPTTPYMNWKEDSVPPSLETCLLRAGIPKSITHKADDDAWDVIQVLRTLYDKILF